MLQQVDIAIAWASEWPLITIACAVALTSSIILITLYARRRRSGAMQPTLDDLAYVRQHYEQTETGPIDPREAYRASALAPAMTLPTNAANPSASGASKIHRWLLPLDPSSSPLAISSDQITIGRAESNDFVLRHETVHRSHAKLEKCGDRYELIDQGGANGSIVNGKRLSRKVLDHGDLVSLGDARLIYYEYIERNPTNENLLA